VAVDLPHEVEETLVRIQTRLKALGAGARWTAKGRMHLTVKFLGELDPPVFDAAVEALALPVAAGGPIRLRVAGLGGFPSIQRARVVWAGLEGDVATLARAALDVEARLGPLGVPRERRPFRPHLTLGRAKKGSVVTGLDQALDAVGSWEGPAFEFGELVLYESQLRPQGPIYTPRLSILLE
jgi:2'-5' RNA ligase